MATSHTADLIGRVLGGRYRLTRRVGQGAFAQVYAADDVRLRRRVAIKVLHPALADEEAFLRRFAAEARAVAALRHPHILKVYDWGDDEGDPYLVMELLEGGSLRTYLDQGHLLSTAQAARVGAEAASALDHAHRRGLVHRDIKPGNLIFDDEGRITVADFGLARALAEATLTEPTGAVVGTARYAAPEQIQGEALDHRADVYSLALVLVEATTGRVPFAQDTSLATLMGRIRTPLSVDPRLGALAPVLEAAGTVAPADRLDAAGLARALIAVSASLPPPAPLDLRGPLSTDRPDQESDPTAMPGRSGPFDIEAVERFTATLHPDVPGPPSAVGSAAASLPVAPDEEPRPSRRRRRRIAAAICTIVGLIAAAIGAYLVTRPAPTEAVPSLEGQTVSTARANLHRLHLHLLVAADSYSATGAPGTVLSQQPTGVRVAEGKTVSVVVSKGPQPIAVPSLSGNSQSAAEGIITALDLKVGTVTQATSMTVSAGSVISSQPSGGTLLPKAAVNLVVSTGKPVIAVPTLSGPQAVSFAAAQAALATVGLGAAESPQYSNTVPAGGVIVTDPAPGATATVGSVVTVEVSKGPHLVTVPSVAHNSVTTASQLLAAAGFSVSGVTGDPTATVTATSPAAGLSALYGSAVQLITG